MKKPTRLKGLTVDEISLVDFPANKGARMTLKKNDDGQDAEGLSVLQTLAKRLGLERFIKTSEELSPPATPAPTSKPTETPVAKTDEGKTPDGSQTPDERVAKAEQEKQELAARVEKAEKSAKEAADRLAVLEKRESERIEKAAVARMAEGTPISEELITKCFRGMNDEARQAFDEVMTKVRALAAASPLFAPVGKAGEEVTKQAELSALVKEIRKADPKITEQQAMDAALLQRPDLYEATI